MLQSLQSRIVSFALVAVAATGNARAGADYQSLIDTYAPSIVTVTMVVKVEMSFGGQSQNREVREEHSGVMVDSSGLVMLSYQPFANNDDEEGSPMRQKRTPTQMNVLFEGEEKEYESQLVATDKKLGLAFVKVKDLAGRQVKVVSFADAVEPELGAEVAGVQRLEKGYDYAPYVETGKINGKLKKPRKAIMCDNAGLAGVGLPVLTLDGKVVGAMVTIDSGIKEDDQGFGFFLRMAGGGQRFILPGKVVSKTIEQALKQAAGEEAAPTDAAKPEDGEKKEGGQ